MNDNPYAAPESSVAEEPSVPVAPNGFWLTDGELSVVDGAVLPPYCVKTNQPTDNSITVRLRCLPRWAQWLLLPLFCCAIPFQLEWIKPPDWMPAHWLLVIGVWSALILQFALQQRGELTFFLVPTYRPSIWSSQFAIPGLILLVILLMPTSWLLRAWFGLFFAFMWLGMRSPKSQLRAARFDGRFTISGCCPEFVERLKLLSESDRNPIEGEAFGKLV